MDFTKSTSELEENSLWNPASGFIRENCGWSGFSVNNGPTWTRQLSTATANNPRQNGAIAFITVRANPMALMWTLATV